MAQKKRAAVTTSDSVQASAPVHSAPRSAVEAARIPQPPTIPAPSGAMVRRNSGTAMSAEEAVRQANEEGLVLVEADNSSGYRGVQKRRPGSCCAGRPFMVNVYINGKLKNVGSFACPEEAALRYARHLGPEGCRKARLEVERASAASLSHDQVLEQLRQEGLHLFRNPHSKTGYLGVSIDTRAKKGRAYEANFTVPGTNGAQTYCGRFYSAIEAALAHARATRTFAEEWLKQDPLSRRRLWPLHLKRVHQNWHGTVAPASAADEEAGLLEAHAVSEHGDEAEHDDEAMAQQERAQQEQAVALAAAPSAGEALSHCAICLEECLEDGSDPATAWGQAMCCQAKFHYQCLCQWFQQPGFENTCPQCRRRPKSVSSRRLLRRQG